MERPITGFDRDEEEHWVALLSCGHRQHVRHQPPFVDRGWTQTDAGREAALGQLLDCPLCDRMEPPEGAQRYKSTPIFTDVTIPKALRREHMTKPGVWGQIRVLDGKLLYEILQPVQQTFTLDRDSTAYIVPEVPHRVEKIRNVIFQVDFLKIPATGD
jgi:tellurite methyltransferase